MVFENIIAGLVNKFLGNYIQNINSKDMTFGLGGILSQFSTVFIVKCETVIVTV